MLTLIIEGERKRKKRENIYANDKSVDPKRTQRNYEKDNITGAGELPSEARSLHPGYDGNTKETELCTPESGKGTAYKRDRSYCLHPGDWTQPAGALCCSSERWKG